MATVYLPDYIDNAEFHLERLIPRLASGSLGWREIQEMTARFRQRGICSLLLYGSAGPFFVNLMQSAGAFLYFLERAADEEKVTSQAKPFYDAVGGGYIDAARAIAGRSRVVWNEGYEYEEDFLYAYLLMRMLFLPESLRECEALLQALDAKAAPVDAPRVDVCRSLLARDNERFAQGVAALIDARQEKVEGMLTRGTLPEEVATCFRPFDSDALAVIRIAEMLGIPTATHYKYVPEEVRPLSPFPFDGDAWRDLAYSPR